MIDLNKLHHAAHQITGAMAVRFNKATPADLEAWAAALRTLADQMVATSKVARRSIIGRCDHGVLLDQFCEQCNECNDPSPRGRGS